VHDATSAGEPLRIVISTDDKEVPAGTAAAFIATARIVQQFLPLEIWWQGSWLNEGRYLGFVNLVPLVQGDMDFARLEFCIADPFRDTFSFGVMGSQAILDVGEVWSGCGYRANKSYLDGARFVSHSGIEPTAESVAEAAAYWLGWSAHYTRRWEEEEIAESAGQSLPPEPVNYKPARVDAETRRQWRHEAQERERNEARQASDRLNH